VWTLFEGVDSRGPRGWGTVPSPHRLQPYPKWRLSAYQRAKCELPAAGLELCNSIVMDRDGDFFMLSHASSIIIYSFKNVPNLKTPREYPPQQRCSLKTLFLEITVVMTV
jgi:hypothetical protein